MARRPELEKIAQHHNMKIGTIADLIRYRIENEKTVEREAEAILPTEFGDFRLLVYRDAIHRDLHFAMVRGDIDAERPTLVRVHIYNPLQDLTGSTRKDAGWPLRDALRRVAEADEGVVIVLGNQIDADEVIRQVQRYATDEQDQNLAARPGAVTADFRQIGLGAQILSDIGVRKMRVMSHPRRYHALSGFGLEVVEYVS
jgi:3,4-dihydroxy 2-butanone 4-phosphate synthase/GTP cyclohydrolase II